MCQRDIECHFLMSFFLKFEGALLLLESLGGIYTGIPPTISSGTVTSSFLTSSQERIYLSLGLFPPPSCSRF